MRRRAFLLGTAALSLTACTSIDSGGVNNSVQGSAGRVLRSSAPVSEPFRTRLPIPPVLPPVQSDATTDWFEIVQRPGTAEILPGLRTEIWGYDGIFPGPTIVSRRGRRTVVRHRNQLPVPTAVHLHGGRVAAEHDGFPTDLVMPPTGGGHMHAAPVHPVSDQGFRDYVYDIDQPAATLWYHDHRLDFTGPQVYRGLAGFHLVHDDLEDSLGLPTGDRDVPVMIADRAFEADGSFRYPALPDGPGVTDDYSSGVLGDVVLVNGAPWPILDVAAVRYRFRLLNASNARRYRLRLDDGPAFTQIGSDQGLLSAPVERDEIEIAQGERYDVVIDFAGYAAGDEITLVNDLGSNGTDQVMRFRVTGPAPDDSRVPERLAPVEVLGAPVTTREFTFARGGASGLWEINGRPFAVDQVAATIPLGTVERWTISAQNVEHPFHVHLGVCQVPDQPGLKDTVNLDNGGRADLLVRFDGHRGRYVLHCHNLEHEDMMMMTVIEVI